MKIFNCIISCKLFLLFIFPALAIGQNGSPNLDMAKALIDAKKYTEAKKLLNSLMANRTDISPLDSADYHHYIGVCQGKDTLTLAIENFKRAAEICERLALRKQRLKFLANEYLNISICYLKLGNYKSAVEYSDLGLTSFKEFKESKKRGVLSSAPTKKSDSILEATNAIGMRVKAGRYGGGTFAHRDIAINFCYWLSPTFQLYLIKEFQRLKEIEAREKQEALEWSVKRLLTKINYTVHTDAIKEELIPPRLAHNKTSGLVYASEADILNLALFGMTAKEWRLQNPNAKGNMRDHATTEQLLVLANLEAINAELIRQGLSQDERVVRLNEAAITQTMVE